MTPKLGQFDVVAQDVLIKDMYFSCRADIVTQPLIDSIHGTEECRFTTPRWPNQRSNQPLLNLKIDLEKRLKVSVPEADVVDIDRQRGSFNQSGPPGNPGCAGLLLHR